jgi:hypothetical protein
LLLKLEADLGIIHTMLALRDSECKTCRVVEAFTKISKESLERHTLYGRVGSLWATPEKVAHKAIRVNPKFQCRPQSVGDTRNV